MIYVNARFLTQAITGVQRFSIELCKELVEIRDDLVFLVPDHDSVLDKSLLSKINILEIKGGYGHYWEQFILPKFLKNQGSPLLLNLGNTAPVLYKNKIFTHHDITYIRFPESYSLKFRLIYRLMASLNFKNSLSFITVSNFSKKDISDFYNVNMENIHVLYNGVNCKFKKNDNKILNHGKPFALAVSSPSYHKNFSALINAFSKIDNPIELKIIGSSTSVFKNFKNHEVNPNIKFLGRISDDELIELYQTAEFFIFPSLYEGFGIPPLEAQACGCPVLASNTASIPEVLGNSALYFNPKDTIDIQNAIEKASVDQVLKHNLIELGFANVKKYSWENSALKLNKIIEEVK